MNHVNPSYDEFSSPEIDDSIKLKALFNCLGSSKTLRSPLTNLSKEMFAKYIRHLLNLDGDPRSSRFFEVMGYWLQFALSMLNFEGPSPHSLGII